MTNQCYGHMSGCHVRDGSGICPNCKQPVGPAELPPSKEKVDELMPHLAPHLQHMLTVLALENIAKWLENGCSAAHAAAELRLLARRQKPPVTAHEPPVDPLPAETRAATSRGAHSTEDAGRPGPSQPPRACAEADQHEEKSGCGSKFCDECGTALTKPDALKCASCDGEDEVAVRPICSRSPICKRCFAIWYDGCTDAEQIRSESLKAQGRAAPGEPGE